MFSKKDKKTTEADIVEALTAPTAGEDWMADYSQEGQLALDMFQTPTEVVVRAPIAGVKPEDIDITVENGMLTVRGARKDDKEVKEEDYYMRETYWGSFSRSVTLPTEVNTEKISAEMTDGVLTVRLVKLTKTAKKVVKIKPKSV